jgi:Cu(I)/Ag(I) efflux system membrane fusion protein
MEKSRYRCLVLVLLAAASAVACRRAAEKPAPAEEQGIHVETPAGTVVLTPEAVKGGGIVLEPARTREVARTVRALGDLEFDARRVAGVSARASGRIERLSAYTGDRVAAGTILGEIYSPDYLAVQAEVLSAAGRAARLSGRPDESGARSFYDAARRKLASFGPTPAEIDALVASGEARALLAIRAPISGVVLESRAVAGAAVAEGADLFKLADPSSLWACVHLTEKDLAAVRPGMTATLRTQAYPGREFRGRLVLVGAAMDASTRTVEGRVELANPDGALKPGMYVEAGLDSADTRPVLTVPAAAVQEFSIGRVVFVQVGPTAFALRPVETGETIGERIEIRAGLSDGEIVVAAGGFFLKSELMKAGLGDEHGPD